ncbi:MAG: SufD family Fe-S cluster assembly protein [Actinomycetota bacterium]
MQTRSYVPFPNLDPTVPSSGPAHLRERRQDAADLLVDASLPTTDDEIWRYSRIGELDPARFSGATEPGPAVPAHGPADASLDAVATVVVRDGHVVSIDVADDVDGLSVRRAEEGTAEQAGPGAAMPEPVDLFAALNDLHTPGGVVVEAARNAVIPGPVVVRVETATTDTVSFPRLVVATGELAELTVVELRTSVDGVALSAPVTELAAAPGSHLRHVVVQDLAPTVWQLGSLVASAARDAQVLVSVAALGGDYARDRIETRIVGSNAHANIQAVYFGEGDQMLDFRTVQDHLAPHTGSDLLFKGAIGGRSHSVYTGNIRIAKDAGDVDAFQTNRNLKLSEDAWAESVPNLEIENNDVRCSHASAIGPIDPDHRFYLEARGVPPLDAERLVVAGFFEEVLERFPVAGVTAWLSDEIGQRLEAVMADDEGQR